jgi:hypothetical protein
MAFSFEFKDDEEQYNNGKKFVRGVDALKFALANRYLHTRDRGALAVALFDDLHSTPHYKNAKETRDKVNKDDLRKMVLALIQESQNRWPERGKAHAFYKQLKEKNPNLIKQILKYGIDYPDKTSNTSVLAQKEVRDGDIPSDAEIDATIGIVCQRDGTEEANPDALRAEIEQQALKTGRRLHPDWLHIVKVRSKRE